jgi:hypothetical protein
VSLVVLFAGLAVLLAGGAALFAAHGQAEAATIKTFAVFGDVNVGSSDTPAAVFGAVCAGIRGSGATVALTTGDSLNDVADTSVTTAVDRWNEYLAVEGPGLAAAMPVWHTPGDNDRVDVAARLTAWNQVFSTYPTSADPSRRWYSKTTGGVHFVLLCSAYAGSMGSVGYVSQTSSSNSAEAKWLVRDLKAAVAARSPSRIVVVTHYPFISGKVDMPYAGAKLAEARALERLFAKYGVDLVIGGDTHVYRRSMLAVHKGTRAYRVPYIQIPPAASTPRSFGVSPIPRLGAAEAGWAPGPDYRGFIKVKVTSAPAAMILTVWKVAVSGGAVSSAEDQRANARALGGTFPNVPAGCSVGAP